MGDKDAAKGKMILHQTQPAKILVDEDEYAALVEAAQAALDALKAIQAESDEWADMPWPVIDRLETVLKKEEPWTR